MSMNYYITGTLQLVTVSFESVYVLAFELFCGWLALMGGGGLTAVEMIKYTAKGECSEAEGRVNIFLPWGLPYGSRNCSNRECHLRANRII